MGPTGEFSVQNSTHILFLDFDGVLHPDAVYLGRQGPTLKSDGALFMWAPILAEILSDFSEVSLVLSTSWVRLLGYKRARSYLPPELQERVIGATWHSSMDKGWVDEIQWEGKTRYDQICRYAARSKLQHWTALDDDALGWAESLAGKLIACAPEHGLSSRETQSELKRRLGEMCSLSRQA
ncbi:HAD domain-containing protein [Pseudomonas sp. lyk4-R2A-10]|uniref:HAD domain-containing protein n=1 Tax=Pseudomonas sp. lyk4-R2A-10 TaxID=3040315 RepID=UPI002554B6A1|nr:HAD domain-containing protein [Pseudomonas sp. lyk4-R2A-10]